MCAGIGRGRRASHLEHARYGVLLVRFILFGFVVRKQGLLEIGGLHLLLVHGLGLGAHIGTVPVVHDVLWHGLVVVVQIVQGSFCALVLCEA